MHTDPDRRVTLDTDSTRPTVALPIDAFNLIAGAAFTDGAPDPTTFVVIHLARDINSETVHTWSRIVGGDSNGERRSHLFDFGDRVLVVGLSANPDDDDDDNLGNG